MIDNIEIGKRIELYRKRKGLTQQELAELMNLSRSSVTQIEQGKRNVTVPELFRFSKELEFPVSEFFAAGEPGLAEPAFEAEKEIPVKERISIPSGKLNYSKFKNILLYLLEHCAGKPNVGETVLYKLLYFSDFNHFEEHEQFLTGATYRKLPFGPVPYHLDHVLEKMIAGGELQKVKTDYFGYPQTRYLPLKKADSSDEIREPEGNELDQAPPRERAPASPAAGRPTPDAGPSRPPPRPGPPP
jgi:transcriptional regulator with XRE-family HTH domain